MAEPADSPPPERPRPRHPSTLAVRLCLLYYCVLGLAFLAMDLVSWARTGHYESPSLWALYALRWLALPGIALAGGAAMVSASSRPPKWGAFALSLAGLLTYAWLWDMADFLTSPPYRYGG